MTYKGFQIKFVESMSVKPNTVYLIRNERLTRYAPPSLQEWRMRTPTLWHRITSLIFGR